MSDQIDVNQLSNAIQQKVDLPSGKSQADIDYVVEWQAPTSGNNYTWYRLYKSGWVEQGGADNTTSNKTVSLPITMADSNYTAICAYNASDNDLSNGAINIGSKTTTSFVIKKWSSDQTSWEVKGFAAQS